MSYVRRFLSIATITATAATLLCAPATPAGAAATDGGTGGVKGHGVVTEAGFWCVAVATPAAWSTSIDSCRLYVDGAFVAATQGVALPGPVATTGGPAAVRPGAQMEVCWQVSADLVLGDRATDTGCASEIAVAAADIGSASGVEGSGGVVAVAPLNPQSSLVAFWCAAVATVPATSVTIESCRVYADGAFVADAEPIALSGEAAATGGLAGVPSNATWTVCWEVSADTFFNGQPTDAGCTAPPR